MIQHWNDAESIFTHSQINTFGKLPKYLVMDTTGKMTDKYSEKFRDLFPEEAKKFFDITDRTVRVGIE